MLKSTHVIAARAFAVLCLMGTATLCLVASSGIFPLNGFDGAIMLSQVLHAAHGFTPYVDYGFSYSPGLAIFFGQILHLTDPALFVRLTWFIIFLLMCMNAVLVMRLGSLGMKYVGAGLMAFAALQPMLALFYSHGVEQFTLPLLTTIMLLTLHFMRMPQNKRRLAFIACAAFVITLIRWDRALMIGLSETGLGLFALILSAQIATFAIDTSHPRSRALALMKAGAFVLVGFGAGLACVALYAFAHDSFYTMWLFVFDLPYRTRDYRTLPFPTFTSLVDEESLWITSLVAFITLVGSGLFMKWRRKGEWKFQQTSLVECLALAAAPLSMTPYALGRSDYIHFVPVAGLMAGALIVGLTIWNKAIVRGVCLCALVFLFVPLSSKLEPVYQSLSLVSVRDVVTLENDLLNKNIAELAGDCTRYIPVNARSLFVGRTSYAHYMYNAMAIYVARPDLKPASLFVAEDPGVQNTCDFGQHVADDLLHAPRPLIAFLTANPQYAEPNFTQYMTSCGRIEHALLAQASTILGTCTVGEFRMIVVEYN